MTIFCYFTITFPIFQKKLLYFVYLFAIEINTEHEDFYSICNREMKAFLFTEPFI